MQLEQEEAAQIGQSVANVAVLYPQLQDLPPWLDKLFAWGTLAGVAIGIYGPRFAAIKIRKIKEKQAQQKQE